MKHRLFRRPSRRIRVHTAAEIYLADTADSGLEIVDSTVSGNAGLPPLVPASQAPSGRSPPARSRSTSLRFRGAITSRRACSRLIVRRFRATFSSATFATAWRTTSAAPAPSSAPTIWSVRLQSCSRLTRPPRADPLLGPLQNNGGPDDSHRALSAESPAIDHGNNAASLQDDQRGNGFPRVVGTNADIGAFEFDSNDVIFQSGIPSRLLDDPLAAEQQHLDEIARRSSYPQHGTASPNSGREPADPETSPPTG